MKFQILECKRFVAPSAKMPIKRITKDYELDYYLKGDRIIYTDGARSSISAGDVCFRRPGQEVYSFGDYDCYIVTLDFSMTAPCENYSRNVPDSIRPQCGGALTEGIPAVFSPVRAGELRDCFEALCRQTDLRTEAAHALAQEILYLIRADLCRSRYNSCKADGQRVDEAKRHIDRNYHRRITLEELSAVTHLEKSYLVRVFKAKFGQSPIDYLIGVRLSHARDLLLSTNMTVTEIAYACGYNNVSFFISHYKKAYRVTPALSRRSGCQSTPPPQP